MPKLPENFTAVGIVCHHFERLAVLQNELVKMLENVLEKLFASKIKEKEETETKSTVWDLKNAKPAQILEQSSSMRQVCVSVFFSCVQKSNQNRNVEAKNRESNRTVIIAINREFD